MKATDPEVFIAGGFRPADKVEPVIDAATKSCSAAGRALLSATLMMPWPRPTRPYDQCPPHP